VSYATGQRKNRDTPGAGPGMFYASLVIQSLFENGYPRFSGLMIHGGTNWETFFLRIDGSHQSQAKVLVVLLTEAFFQSIPCLKEVYAAVKKGDVYIIPIRVDLKDYDISFNYGIGILLPPGLQYFSRFDSCVCTYCMEYEYPSICLSPLFSLSPGLLACSPVASRTSHSRITVVCRTPIIRLRGRPHL
jgi:hypothetical protein